MQKRARRKKKVERKVEEIPAVELDWSSLEGLYSTSLFSLRPVRHGFVNGFFSGGVRDVGASLRRHSVYSEAVHVRCAV